MEKSEENQTATVKKRVILLAIKIVLFIVICIIVFFVIFGVGRMNDYSMYPSLKDGDLLVYYRMEGNFNNGDVVVVNHDNQEKVMRIIASPGQEVDIDDDGELSVDQQPSTYEAFYKTNRAEKYSFKYPYRVSQDCYFMLNDYRSNTDDSRTFGEVCKDKIKGRLISKIQIRDF